MGSGCIFWMNWRQGGGANAFVAQIRRTAYDGHDMARLFLMTLSRNREEQYSQANEAEQNKTYADEIHALLDYLNNRPDS